MKLNGHIYWLIPLAILFLGIVGGVSYHISTSVLNRSVGDVRSFELNYIWDIALGILILMMLVLLVSKIRAIRQRIQKEAHDKISE